MAVRFVYFDLDDTLLDHRAAERAALNDLKAERPDLFGGFSEVEIQRTYHEHNVVFWRRYGSGEITRDDVRVGRFEKLVEALGVGPTDCDLLGDRYMELYGKHWCWLDGAREAFLTTAARYRTGIISNGFASAQRAKLQQFVEIRETIAVSVISEDVGFMKPDRRIFEHAERLAGVPREEILYVGDSWHSDIQGAQNAGWQALWLTPSVPENLPDGVRAFHHWQEFVAHLDGLVAER